MAVSSGLSTTFALETLIHSPPASSSSPVRVRLFAGQKATLIHRRLVFNRRSQRSSDFAIMEDSSSSSSVFALKILKTSAADCTSKKDCDIRKQVEMIQRRQAVFSSLGLIAGAIFVAPASAATPSPSQFADMPALRGKDYGKTKMRYPDYTETASGLQYKDLRLGTGPAAQIGETVLVDWDGYTIGYYGRIFEARNKTKGGSFEGDDKEFFKFSIGSQEVILAFEEAIMGMCVGGVRRIIVPPELGYPDNDFNKKGPRPTTFSGQRALDFVLRNQGLIDKTLLFDIELLKIVPS